MIITIQSALVRYNNHFRPDNYDEGWYQDETTGEWYNQFDWIQDENTGEWYYEDRSDCAEGWYQDENGDWYQVDPTENKKSSQTQQTSGKHLTTALISARNVHTIISFCVSSFRSDI